MPRRRTTTVRVDATAGDAAPPLVWAVGPWREGEFADIIAEVPPTSSWVFLPDLRSAAARAATTDALPEVVLIAQPRPGVDSQSLVDRLLALAPLARIVVAAGTWCDGELRTGRPLAGVHRLPWRQFPTWWRDAGAARSLGVAPSWSVVDGAACAESRRISHGQAAEAIPVAIATHDFSAYETIASVIQTHGFLGSWHSRAALVCSGSEAKLPHVGIFDAAQLDPQELEDLGDFCDELAGAPVLVLVDFPRREHRDLIERVGAAITLGKPYPVAALVAELGRLVRDAQRTLPSAAGQGT